MQEELGSVLQQPQPPVQPLVSEAEQRTVEKDSESYPGTTQPGAAGAARSTAITALAAPSAVPALSSLLPPALRS